MSSIVGAGEEAIEGDSLFGPNCFNADGESANTTILLCFLDDLSLRPVVSDIADVVTVVVDIDTGRVQFIR